MVPVIVRKSQFLIRWGFLSSEGAGLGQCHITLDVAIPFIFSPATTLLDVMERDVVGGKWTVVQLKNEHNAWHSTLIVRSGIEKESTVHFQKWLVGARKGAKDVGLKRQAKQ